MGRKTMDRSFIGSVKMLAAFIFPITTHFLKLKIIPDEVADYFRNTTKEVIRYRDENNVKRNDFLATLLEIKAKDPKFDHEDLTAHSVGLFIDGFETSSIAMSFLLYALAAHPRVQDKLRQEFEDALAKGEVTYEVLTSLPYLDAVLMETLRIYPPAPFMMRRCTQPFKFPRPDGKQGKQVDVPVGAVIMVPLLGIQRDEKHFRDATTFRPERFYGEQKEDYHKYTFMPFGEGPRICLGMRFGVTQLKTAVFHIVTNFDITVNNKTIQPLEIDPSYFLMAAKGGIWLNFHKRK